MNAFEHSVLRVMSVLSGRQIITRDTNATPNRLPPAEYYGCITIDGFLSGKIILAINSQTATDIAAVMTLAEPADINQTILLDTIGEIANQIAGKFRTVLSEFGHNFDISTPVVTTLPPNVNFADFDNSLTHSIVFNIDDEFFTGVLLACCVPNQ